MCGAREGEMERERVSERDSGSSNFLVDSVYTLKAEFNNKRAKVCGSPRRR